MQGAMSLLKKHNIRMLPVMKKAKLTESQILTSYDGAPEDYQWVYIRMYHIDRSKIENFKTDLGEKTTLLYMVNHLENRRQMYE